MRLPIIQSLWIGDPLTNLEKLCIQSFLDHGHEFHLYVYDDVQGIPEGATIKDGNKILPASNIFRHHRRGSYAPFSDWFRYTLLYQHGGFWVDMDVVCIKPFDFDDDIVFGCTADEYLKHAGIANSIMAFPKGHEVLAKMVTVCRDPNAEVPWGDERVRTEKKIRRLPLTKPIKFSYGEFGPKLLGNVVRHYKLTNKTLPFTAFYPIDSSQCVHLFNRSFPSGKLYPDTFAVHFWNEALRHIDVGMNSQFDSKSLFEQLKTKHNIAQVPNAQQISNADITGKWQLYTHRKVVNLKQAKRRRAMHATILVLAIVGLVVALVLSRLSN